MLQPKTTHCVREFLHTHSWSKEKNRESKSKLLKKMPWNMLKTHLRKLVVLCWKFRLVQLVIMADA